MLPLVLQQHLLSLLFQFKQFQSPVLMHLLVMWLYLFPVTGGIRSFHTLARRFIILKNATTVFLVAANVAYDRTGVTCSHTSVMFTHTTPQPLLSVITSYVE